MFFGVPKMSMFLLLWKLRNSFPGNIFRPTRLPLNPSNQSRLGSGVGPMTNAKIDVLRTL